MKDEELNNDLVNEDEIGKVEAEDKALLEEKSVEPDGFETETDLDRPETAITIEEDAQKEVHEEDLNRTETPAVPEDVEPIVPIDGQHEPDEPIQTDDAVLDPEPIVPLVTPDSSNDAKPIKDKEKQSKRRRLWWLFGLLALIVMGLFFWLIFGRDAKPTDTVSLDDKAIEKMAKLEKPVTIDIPGYPTTIALEAGTGEAYIDLYNPKENTAYLMFEIVLGEVVDDVFVEKEVLYTSELVEPGFSVEKQELSRALDKGQYAAAINIQAYTYNKETEAVQELNGAQNTIQFNVVDSSEAAE